MKLRFLVLLSMSMMLAGCGGGGSGGAETATAITAVANNPQACFVGPVGILNLAQNYQVKSCSTGLALTAAQVEATGLQTVDRLQIDYSSTPQVTCGGNGNNTYTTTPNYSFFTCAKTVEVSMCVVRTQWVDVIKKTYQERLIGCSVQVFQSI